MNYSNKSSTLSVSYKLVDGSFGYCCNYFQLYVLCFQSTLGLE